MDKLDVNGPGAHPLYKYMRECQPTSVGGGSRVPNGSSAIEWYLPSSSFSLCFPTKLQITGW